MLKTNDIITPLLGKTHTLGWDAVVAYDRDKINHLLEQQYVSKRAEGTSYPIIDWQNSDKTRQYSGLMLSAPLISFENSTITDSELSVTMEFIRGSIAKINSNKQVTQYTRIRPGMGYYLKLSVDLKKGNGSVGKDGEVILDLSAASIQTTNIDEDPAAEIIPYIGSWLQNNPVRYVLGKLKMESQDTSLLPTDFVIRTQPSKDTSRAAGHGAVLLFVKTTAHPANTATSLPDASYPWLIPDDHSSAILINSRIIMESFIKPGMDKLLGTNSDGKKGEWLLKRDESANNSAWSLESSKKDANKGTEEAILRREYIRVTTEDGETGIVWSGKFKNKFGDMYGEVHDDFIYSIGGMTITGGSTLSLNLSSVPTFKQHFCSKLLHTGGNIVDYYYEQDNVTFTLTGEGNYSFEVDSEKETIQIKGDSNNFSISDNYVDTLGHYETAFIGKELQKTFAKQLRETLISSLNDLINNVDISPVKVLAVDNLLFPGQNINKLKVASLPGDMIVFGDISPELTSLNITPLTSTIAVKQSLQFTSNNKVTWSVSPADSGTIDANGLYQAPSTLKSSLLNVKITATGTDGATASAYVDVVPSTIIISPAFQVIQEVKDIPSKLQFSASLTDGMTLTGWSVEPAEPGSPTGTIDKNGLYTTPSSAWPKGYSWVNVMATASDGRVAITQLLLISRTTHPEFPITPSLVTEIALWSNQTFSASGNDDFKPEEWSLHPAEESGTLSDPVISGPEDEEIYTVTYTPPQSVDGNKLVIIKTEGDSLVRLGYALVDVGYNKE